MPPNGNLLPGRFVLPIKLNIDGKTVFKSRYVVGDQRDRIKESLAHSSNIVQPQPVRFITSISSTNDFEIWGSDVKQAYLQAKEHLGRNL